MQPRLLMRSIYGTGKPRAAHDQSVDAILAILALISILESAWLSMVANSDELPHQAHRDRVQVDILPDRLRIATLDTGC